MRDAPLRIVVMGVASSGKSTVASALAHHLRAAYLDADDFHPPANVAKMASGSPLSDDDRWAWLASLRDQLAARDRVVLACSALRVAYRDLLRQPGEVRFVFLDVDEETATRRAENRKGHFMAAAMVASQFATLERPDSPEGDVVRVDASARLEQVLQQAIAGISQA